MSKWKDHYDYHKDIGPKVDSYLKSAVKPDVINILQVSQAFFGFLSEDMGPKVRKNNALHPKLDLFLVFAYDQIRSSTVLYQNLNLAPTGFAARATFENYISQKYIVENSDPAKFADLYNRYREIEIIKGHRNSKILAPLPQARIDAVLSANPEWVDPVTKKLVKKPHWTAVKGMNFEKMVTTVKKTDLYSLYRTTSSFVHASPITLNLYKSNHRGFGPIPDEIQARRMALLIAMFSLEIMIDYCKFFGVEYDTKEYFNITAELNRLTA